MICRCKSYMKKLCSMKVKDDLDFSMTISCPDENGDTSCFNKRITSNTEFSLIKALGVILAVGSTIWMLCFLCSLCSVFKKK